MKLQRMLVPVLCGALVLVGCSSDTGDGVSSPQPLSPRQSDDGSTPEERSDALSAALTEVAAVSEACETEPGESIGAVDYSNRTWVAPDLRCADMSGIDLSGVSVGISVTDEYNEATEEHEAGRVDWSGADLSGADLRFARISVKAVGADFSGADLRGADLLDSDLRGANFNGANLTGSKMTTYPDGLAAASLRGALMGCNELAAGPGVDLTNVEVDDDCLAGRADWGRMTLAGNLDQADMSDFDFTNVVVLATSFRGADMQDVVVVDKGVFPVGADFTGADLSGADLSGTGFYDAILVDADLSGATLEDTYFSGVTGDGSLMVDVDGVGIVMEHSTFDNADFNGADLSGSVLRRVTFEGALLAGADLDGAVVVDIQCPSGALSLEELGWCEFEVASS